jgi:hypothetical protein
MTLMDMGTYAHPLAIKAWKISDDERSHIVWCDHGLQAKRLGAEALELSFEEVECERYPQLDGFHGDLLAWMLENGWTFECGQCYQHTGLETDGFVRDDGDDIFCSVACADKHRVLRDERERLQGEFQRFAEVKYFGLDPHVQYVNVGGDALVYLNPSPPTVAYCEYIDRAELGAL